MFHLVSLSLQISLTDLPGPCLGLCVGVACFVACLGGFVVGFFLTGKFDLNHMLIPVVDRPCLALVRQCRKKKQRYCIQCAKCELSPSLLFLHLAPCLHLVSGPYALPFVFCFFAFCLLPFTFAFCLLPLPFALACPCTAVHCTTLQYLTLTYLTLPYVTLRYVALPYITLRYVTFVT